jgi:hypothetical protein
MSNVKSGASQQNREAPRQRVMRRMQHTATKFLSEAKPMCDSKGHLEFNRDSYLSLIKGSKRAPAAVTLSKGEGSRVRCKKSEASGWTRAQSDSSSPRAFEAPLLLLAFLVLLLFELGNSPRVPSGGEG